MGALATMPSPSLPSLYDLEENLTALADTMEMVGPDHEEQFLKDFEAALTSAADKRDRVAHFLAFCEAQQEFAKKEINRLKDLAAYYDAIQERIEQYVIRVVQAQGKDAKGKWRKLEGHTTMMYIQRNPESVEIAEGAEIPLDYQRATVNLSAEQWQHIINSLPEFVFTTCKLEPDKQAIKAALNAGVEIEGAKLVTDKYGLRRR